MQMQDQPQWDPRLHLTSMCWLTPQPACSPSTHPRFVSVYIWCMFISIPSLTPQGMAMIEVSIYFCPWREIGISYQDGETNMFYLLLSCYNFFLFFFRLISLQLPNTSWTLTRSQQTRSQSLVLAQTLAWSLISIPRRLEHSRTSLLPAKQGSGQNRRRCCCWRHWR